MYTIQVFTPDGEFIEGHTHSSIDGARVVATSRARALVGVSTVRDASGAVLYRVYPDGYERALSAH